LSALQLLLPLSLCSIVGAEVEREDTAVVEEEERERKKFVPKNLF